MNLLPHVFKVGNVKDVTNKIKWKQSTNGAYGIMNLLLHAFRLGFVKGVKSEKLQKMYNTSVTTGKFINQLV